MAANLDRAETSLTAVSDIAYIRGIDGSGNSVRISKADLASVLGGQTSMKAKFIEGHYKTRNASQDSDSPINKWINDIQTGDIWGYQIIGPQLFQTAADGTIYIRSLGNDAKSTWQKIELNIPQFYKNYDSLSSLASALGDITRLKSYDINIGETIEINIIQGLCVISEQAHVNLVTIALVRWATFEIIKESNNSIFTYNVSGSKLRITNNGQSNTVVKVGFM